MFTLGTIPLRPAAYGCTYATRPTRQEADDAGTLFLRCLLRSGLVVADRPANEGLQGGFVHLVTLGEKMLPTTRMPPSWQTGAPIHFHASMIPGSTSRMLVRS